MTSVTRSRPGYSPDAEVGHAPERQSTKISNAQHARCTMAPVVLLRAPPRRLTSSTGPSCVWVGRPDKPLKHCQNDPAQVPSSGIAAVDQKRQCISTRAKVAERTNQICSTCINSRIVYYLFSAINSDHLAAKTLLAQASPNGSGWHKAPTTFARNEQPHS